MECESDSARLPLDLQPRVTVPRPWRRRFETVAVLAMLVGGGFGMGFAVSNYTADAKVARARDDHQRELERLQEAWRSKLEGLAGRVSDAAGTSAAAAQVAGEAATTAQAAATTAARAAKDAKK